MSKPLLPGMNTHMLHNHRTHSHSTQLAIKLSSNNQTQQSKQRRRDHNNNENTNDCVQWDHGGNKSIQRPGKAETRQILAVPVLFKFYLKDLQRMV